MLNFASIIAFFLIVNSSFALRLNNDFGSESEGEPPKEVVTAQPNPNDPLFHIYVLNLANRADKCDCMRRQLADSVVPVFRHDAVTPDTVDQYCPNLARKTFQHSPDVGPSFKPTFMAYFCSNYMLWKKVYEDPKRPPYIVYMEDDLVDLPTNLTEVFHTVLSSDCVGGDKEWDMIPVDTHYGSRRAIGFGGQETKCIVNDINIRLKTTGGFGAHTLIIRTEALPKLLKLTKDNKIAMNHMDDWPAMLHKKGVKSKFWHPHLVRQATKGPQAKEPIKSTVCDWGLIKRTDLKFAKEVPKHLYTCPKDA